MSRHPNVRWIVLCGVFFMAGSSYGMETTEIVKAYQDAVVVVAAYGRSGEPVTLGSGFIVLSTGVVVTNRHVVEGKESLIVRLSNKAYLPIVEVRLDDSRDLALLFLDGRNLPTVNLGDSEKIQVGERVVVIGHPQGLTHSVSEGIVSAYRENKRGVKIIQTTASASPGSSGSPLFNLRGEVMGVMVATVKSGQNLNFAIPVQYVRGLLRNRPSLENGFGDAGSKSKEIKKQVLDKSSATAVASPLRQGVREAIKGNLERAKEIFRREATSDKAEGVLAWTYLAYVYSLQERTTEAHLAYETSFRGAADYLSASHVRDEGEISWLGAMDPEFWKKRERGPEEAWEHAATTNIARVHFQDPAFGLIEAVYSFWENPKESGNIPQLADVVDQQPVGCVGRWRGLAWLADAYVHSQESDRAMSTYTRLVEEFPWDPEGSRRFAEGAIKLGRMDAARLALQETTASLDSYQNPCVIGKPKMMRLIGEAYCRLGDKVKAKEQYENLRRLVSGYEATAATYEAMEPTLDYPDPGAWAGTCRREAAVAKKESEVLIKVIFP